MDIPINAPVQAADGPSGKISGLLINPISRAVTHIIVQEPGFLADEVLVPIAAVTASAADSVTLSLTRDEVAKQRPINRADYLDATMIDVVSPYGGLLAWPYAVDDPDAVPIERATIPEGEVEIWPGFDVHATDGRVGSVDELLVDARTSAVTGLVLREGHLWSARDVTIPADQIDRIDEGAVYLKLSKAEVGALPAVKLKRLNS